ncbi:MAG: hypothetical protein N2578_00390 [Bdellovibrionaceae bacterium]|nr:hypothetical protein [Pseudobdellovibrionaceae bacterium]
MGRNKLFKLALMAQLLITGCSGYNQLKAMAPKNSDEALYEDALKAVNAGQYDSAISIINNQISLGFRSNPPVVRTLTSAYSGKCGLDFLTFIEGIQSGGSSPFALAMSGFTNASVVTSGCQNAQNTIENYFGTSPSQRTPSDNFFMAFLGLAKIGAMLRSKADVNQDGNVDTGFDVCDSGDISDNEIKYVGTGLGLLLQNITAVGAALGGAGSAINALDTLCDSLPPPNPCEITDVNSSNWTTGTMGTITMIRRLAASTSFGITAGFCSNYSNPATCCP